MFFYIGLRKKEEKIFENKIKFFKINLVKKNKIFMMRFLNNKFFIYVCVMFLIV